MLETPQTIKKTPNPKNLRRKCPLPLDQEKQTPVIRWIVGSLFGKHWLRCIRTYINGNLSCQVVSGLCTGRAALSCSATVVLSGGIKDKFLQLSIGSSNVAGSWGHAAHHWNHVFCLFLLFLFIFFSILDAAITNYDVSSQFQLAAVARSSKNMVVVLLNYCWGLLFWSENCKNFSVIDPKMFIR